jgi:hypothetical protein
MTTKRASLFSRPAAEPAPPPEPTLAPPSKTVRPAARVGKRVVGAYVSPECWKQLQLIAVDENTTVQSLLIEGLNHVFAARAMTRLAE